jgi:hypothetical protein
VYSKDGEIGTQKKLAEMQKQTMAKELTKERKERKQDKDEIQNLTVDLISKDTMINN